MAAFRLAAMDSESGYLPLDYLQGHKDGLEWAAQLAEANHPETGDWLYDDPIELAKAIRKGPDMQPAQPVADSEPVAEITEDLGRLFVKIHYPTTLRAGEKLYRHAQPAPVVPEEMTPEMMRSVQLNSELGAYAASNLSGAYDLFAEFWKEACRAAMLAAATQSPGSDPATVPGKWIPVSEQMPDVGVKVLCFPAKDEPIHATFNGQLWLQDVSWSGSEEPIDNVIPVTVTHWMPLPAAPQEVK
ncbi:TPA: DUF551 domain-containing protein [Klebsiella pneumoniae]|nr:DUF551 domain-containing protein [Klebsiella pneumoniae]